MNGKSKQADQTLDEFLAGYDAAEFPHPSVTVDVALLTADEGQLHALLLRRDQHPARGKWALPGGFVRLDESLEDAAHRVLAEKANLKGIFLEQLYTFGDPKRDPRTRVITVAYYALVPAQRLPRDIGTTAVASSQQGAARTMVRARLEVPWSGERGGPVRAHSPDGRELPLAFDHTEILGQAVKRLRGKLAYAPIGFELLPRRFTLRDLQQIHETILGKRLNKDSFRRSMLASGLIAATGKREAQVGHRPAELYQFRRTAMRD